jgi:dipeptidyl aminopeptidase/acylaminoacyl peptidase
LWVFDVTTGQGKQVATFPGDYIQSTQWTSSGKILCTPVRGLVGITDVVAVDPNSGKTEVLLHGVNRQGLSPVLSPDQKTIALNYDPDPTDARYPYHHEVAVMPVAGGAPRVLTHGFSVSSSAQWDPTGDGLWVTGYDPGHLEGPGRRVYHVSMANGDAVPITPASEVAHAVAPSPDGQLIAYLSSQLNGLSTLYVARRDRGERRELLKLTPKGESLDLGRVSPVTWTSKDGTKLFGILYLPSSGDTHHLPMIVDIHGGPVFGLDGGLGPLLFTTPFERSYWTGLGYAVFAVDYRQSTIYGWDKVTAARKAHENFDRDAVDIISGVNSLVKSGVADPRRIVAIGHSYGSCEINWLVTHDNPFAAAISYDGCGAPVAEFAATSLDGDNGSHIWTYDGYPWTNPESYRKQAATTYAGQIHTPTLFVANALGLGRFAEGEQILYEASRAKGVPSGYILYRDEPHVLQRLANQRDLLERSLQWVRRFTSTPGGADKGSTSDRH